MGDDLWCFAWTTHDPDDERRLAVIRGRRRSEPYFCSGTLTSTRADAWDEILKTWFGTMDNEHYYRTWKQEASGESSISRAGVIAYLKRRGGRVFKVKIEVA